MVLQMGRGDEDREIVCPLCNRPGILRIASARGWWYVRVYHGCHGNDGDAEPYCHLGPLTKHIVGMSMICPKCGQPGIIRLVKVRRKGYGVYRYVRVSHEDGKLCHIGPLDEFVDKHKHHLYTVVKEFINKHKHLYTIQPEPEPPLAEQEASTSTESAGPSEREKREDVDMVAVYELENRLNKLLKSLARLLVKYSNKGKRRKRSPGEGGD